MTPEFVTVLVAVFDCDSVFRLAAEQIHLGYAKPSIVFLA
jgi:hypothetical protein